MVAIDNPSSIPLHLIETTLPPILTDKCDDLPAGQILESPSDLFRDHKLLIMATLEGLIEQSVEVEEGIIWVEARVEDMEQKNRQEVEEDVVHEAQNRMVDISSSVRIRIIDCGATR